MLNYLIEPVFDDLSVTNRHSDLPIKHVIFPIVSSWITRGHFPGKPLQVVVIHSQQHGFQGSCHPRVHLWFAWEDMDVFGNRVHTEIHGVSIFDVNKSRNDYWFIRLWSSFFSKGSPLPFGWCIHFRSTPWVFPPCFRSAPGALQRLWWAERGNVHCNGALVCLTCLEPIRKCPKVWLCTPESSILLFFPL